MRNRHRVNLVQVKTCSIVFYGRLEFLLLDGHTEAGRADSGVNR